MLEKLMVEKLKIKLMLEKSEKFMLEKFVTSNNIFLV